MVSAQVTLTSADTNYNLETLVAAIATTSPLRSLELILFAPSSNTSAVLIGDGSLASNRYAVSLDPLQAYTFRSTKPMRLKRFLARSAGASQKLNVGIVWD